MNSCVADDETGRVPAVVHAKTEHENAETAKNATAET